jgi:hypothetical protein
LNGSAVRLRRRRLQSEALFRRSTASIMVAASATPLPAISCALPCATEENRIGLPIVSAATALCASSFAAMCH